MSIHPTAIIDANAKIDPSCTIGPYAVIGAEVVMGPGNSVGAHTVMEGPTIIGENNKFYPSCMIGLDPQSTGFKGERSTVIIGNQNTFREMVQIHRSIYEGGKTSVGNNNFIMGNSHIAHDCTVHNQCIFANGATLAGHVEVFDRAFLSGFATVVQFRKVGTMAFLSVHARIVKDIPPYVFSIGENGDIAGLNMVGLRRAGIDAANRREIKKAYKLYFRSHLSLNQAHKAAESELDLQNPYVKEFVDFIKNSKWGIPRAMQETEDLMAHDA